MSRSDGNFPEYQKTELNPLVWPENYWDYSYQCLECDVRWPATPEFTPSVCCRAKIRQVAGAPDVRWPEAVYELKAKRFEEAYSTWNEGKTDHELRWSDEKIQSEIDKFIEEAECSTIIESN
jgi:hypothetical protein